MGRTRLTDLDQEGEISLPEPKRTRRGTSKKPTKATRVRKARKKTAPKKAAPAKAAPKKVRKKISPAAPTMVRKKVAPKKVRKPAKSAPKKGRKKVTPAKVAPKKTRKKVAPAKVAPKKTRKKVAPAKVAPKKTRKKVAPAKAAPKKVRKKLAPAKALPKKVRKPAKIAPKKVRKPAKVAPKKTRKKATPAKHVARLPEPKREYFTDELTGKQVEVQTEPLTRSQKEKRLVELQSLLRQEKAIVINKIHSSDYEGASFNLRRVTAIEARIQVIEQGMDEGILYQIDISDPAQVSNVAVALNVSASDIYTLHYSPAATGGVEFIQ